MPAQTLKAGAALRGLHLTEELEDDIRFERLNAINQKLLFHKPRLVIMYGLTHKKWFEGFIKTGDRQDDHLRTKKQVTDRTITFEP